MQQSTCVPRNSHSVVARCFLAACLLILGMAVSVNRSFAQDRISVSSLQKDSAATVWHVLKTAGSVTVSYQFVDCGPLEMVQFRISNISADKVTVGWKYRIFQNGTEKNLNPEDAAVKLTLAGNSSLKGACYTENTQLSVLIRESGLMPLATDIELTDILISTAQ